VPIKIHRRMKAVYGDGCMDVKNVRKWVRRAKSCCAGEMSVVDEHGSGRPISVTRDENQCRVDAMIQENRRIKQRNIALKLGISQERAHHVIEILNYRKVCTSWVPRQLTDPMKEHRKTVAQELLNLYRLEGDDLLKNIASPPCACVFKVVSRHSGCPTVPCMHIYSPHTCPTSFILILDFITQITCAKKYTSQSSSLCSFLLSPVTASVLGPKRFLSTLNTLSLRSSPV